MDNPLPPKLNGYCIYGRGPNFLIRTIDRGLQLAMPRGASANCALQPPRAILLSNLGHLGDVIVSTAVMPLLRQAFPNVRIGWLVGSWAHSVLEGHVNIDRIHCVDHFLANRQDLPLSQKLARHIQSHRVAKSEIRAADYDTAIDFRWHFPNALPLLWQCRIPVRIGYGTGGFGRLATHCVDFDDRLLNVSQRLLNLAAVLPIGAAQADQLLPSIPLPTGMPASIEALVAGGRPIVILHIGAGASYKEWPIESWRRLAENCVSDGFNAVFTGHGDRECAMAKRIGEGRSGCLDLTGRLTWAEQVATVAAANVVVTGDTSASHVASAARTPCVVLMPGRFPYLWRPMGDRVTSLTSDVPCSPCHRSYGCTGMECIRTISDSSVLDAVRGYLRR